jgi:hypothetical protein
MRQPGTIYSCAAEELFPHSVARLVARRGLLHAPTMPPSRAGRCTMRDWSRRRKLSERTFDAQWCARARARDGQPGARERVETVIPARARIIASAARVPARDRALALSGYSASCPKSPAIILKRLNISESAPGTHYKRPRSARGPTHRDPADPKPFSRAASESDSEGGRRLSRALARAFSKRQRSSKSLRGAHTTFASSSPHLPSCHLD